MPDPPFQFFEGLVPRLLHGRVTRPLLERELGTRLNSKDDKKYAITQLYGEISADTAAVSWPSRAVIGLLLKSSSTSVNTFCSDCCSLSQHQWFLLRGLVLPASSSLKTVTRRRSCSSWDLLFPLPQCSDRQYKSVNL